MRHAVLITGAAGYIGGLTTRALAKDPHDFDVIVATDVREVPEEQRQAGVIYREVDITKKGLAKLLQEHGIDTVVHLAAIVNPPAGDTRELQYQVDVIGTRNVLEACVEAGAAKFIYTSSGAAYGYMQDNKALLLEDDALRAGRTFAYGWHKRLVEEDLARYREQHPELQQLVFRVSTILGPSVDNQITAMFERPVVLGLTGVATPFCIVSDDDVVHCLINGIHRDDQGTYNLTGDGVLTLREIAAMMGHRYVALPERVVKSALKRLARFKLVRYGPEQTAFLANRPVLGNARLKGRLGYRPKTTRQAFERYRDARSSQRGA